MLLFVLRKLFLGHSICLPAPKLLHLSNCHVDAANQETISAPISCLSWVSQRASRWHQLIVANGGKSLQ